MPSSIAHQSWRTTPYGEVWREASAHSGTGKLKQAFLYTGKEFDEETGLTYFGARYYDSRRARWISADPALESYLPASSDQSSGEEVLPGAGGVFRPVNLSDYEGRDLMLSVGLVRV